MKRLICYLFHGAKYRMLPIHGYSRCRKCLTEWPAFGYRRVK